MWSTVFAVSVAVLAAGEAAKLPSYIKPCSRSSSNEVFSECLIKSANAAIPRLAEGDKKFHIPSVKPLEVPSLTLSQGTSQVGLNLTWSPGYFWGLEATKIKDAKVDLAKRHTELKVLIPNFAITGMYSSNGRVLLLPIKGSGPSSVNVTNLLVHYEYDWPSEKGPDGKMHFTVVNSKVSILDVGSMSMKFEGLFNGDKTLEDNMNLFLNENWRELVKELGPGLSEACGEVMRLIFTNIAKMVPEDDMTLP